MDPTRALLRHFLAALAYRTQKALRDAPPSFANFRAVPTLRTPHELVWHLSGLIGYARTFFPAFVGSAWQPERLERFDDEVRRFHELLVELSGHLERGDQPSGASLEQLLQGPLADAMTHVGQIALLRRIAGSPVPPENFMKAAIDPANLSEKQPHPAAPKPDWKPEQPPPAPGRPIGST